jgi:hypothetical protein
MGHLWNVSFQFPNLIDGRISWKGDQPVARPLPTQDNININTEHTLRDIRASMGFELTIPMLERVKIFHASEWVATVTGNFNMLFIVFLFSSVILASPQMHV